MLNLLKRPRPAMPNEVEVAIPADAPRPAPEHVAKAGRAATPNRKDRRRAGKATGQNYISQEQYDKAYGEHLALRDKWIEQEERYRILNAELRVGKILRRYMAIALIGEALIIVGLGVALAVR